MRSIDASAKTGLRMRAGIVGVVSAIAAAFLMVFGAAHAAGHDDGAPDALAGCVVCAIAQAADHQAPAASAEVSAPFDQPAATLVAFAGAARPAAPVLVFRSRGPPAFSPAL